MTRRDIWPIYWTICVSGLIKLTNHKLLPWVIFYQLAWSSPKGNWHVRTAAYECLLPVRVYTACTPSLVLMIRDHMQFQACFTCCVTMRWKCLQVIYCSCVNQTACSALLMKPGDPLKDQLLTCFTRVSAVSVFRGNRCISTFSTSALECVLIHRLHCFLFVHSVQMLFFCGRDGGALHMSTSLFFIIFIFIFYLS